MDENTQALYTQYMNDLNAMQQANNNWSAEQAQIAREWDYFMSSTAHEREVADLRRAGLNPVLSAGGSGATTGSAAMAESSGSGIAAMASLMSKMLDASMAQSFSSGVSAQAIQSIVDKDHGEDAFSGFAPSGISKGESKGIVDIAKSFADPIIQRNEQQYIRDAITGINKDYGNVFIRKSAKRNTVNKPIRNVSSNVDTSARSIFESYSNAASSDMDPEAIERAVARLVSLGSAKKVNQTFLNVLPFVPALIEAFSRLFAKGYNDAKNNPTADYVRYGGWYWGR